MGSIRSKRCSVAVVWAQCIARVTSCSAIGSRSRCCHRKCAATLNGCADFNVKARLPAGYVRPPVHRIANINSSEGREQLAKLAPDVCVLMLHPILGSKTFSIPRLGMLVFHPGVTPEYRGPHSAFWATMNNEFWGIGWSLLRVDAGIDTGPVLAQGTCYGARPLEQTHIVMQHLSHVEGVKDVVKVLQQLERGEQPRVEMVNRKSTNYTHPGLSDYLRYVRVRKRVKADQGPAGDPKPRGVL